MKQKLLLMIVILTITFSGPSYAEDVEKNYSPLFVIPDILIYRPVGLAVTAVGACLFAAISPFTALAQISPPHNAFKKAADVLIMGPANYTFNRPVGDMYVTRY